MKIDYACLDCREVFTSEAEVLTCTNCTSTRLVILHQPTDEAELEERVVRLLRTPTSVDH